MAIHNQPGRGRKFCNNCQKYVGVRSRICPNCSAVFGLAKKTSTFFAKVNLEPKEIPVKGDDITIIENEDDDIKESSLNLKSRSRIDKINSLKNELIRELKISSKSYGQEIINDIINALQRGS